MTQSSMQSYAARLIIAIPGQNKQASMVVTLVPEDSVVTNGLVKPLADCTLVELRAYANELERDVWEAYEQITLLDLDASPEVEVELTLIPNGANEMELENWEGQWLVLPGSSDAAVSTTAAETDIASETAFKPESLEADGEQQEDKDAPQSPGAPSPQVVEKQDTAVVVEAKPVVEPVVATSRPLEAEKGADSPFVPEEEDEVEAAVMVGKPLEEAEEEPSPSATSAPSGVIAPSKARVRVAGTRLPLGDRTWAAVDILMDEPPLRAMQAHALTSLDREVAGVMIGPRPEKQPDGRYLVHVIDAIAAKYTVMHGASVTYTPESWRYLNDTLQERYPDESAVMIGWYHTHPGFGIFLSGMDQFIHQNFFTQIWHIAYVLDPRARTSGFFCWDRRKTKVNRQEFAWPDWAAGAW